MRLIGVMSTKGTWIQNSFVCIFPLEAIEQENNSFNAHKIWESSFLLHGWDGHQVMCEKHKGHSVNIKCASNCVLGSIWCARTRTVAINKQTVDLRCTNNCNIVNSMGLQRVRHNLVTKTNKKKTTDFCVIIKRHIYLFFAPSSWHRTLKTFGISGVKCLLLFITNPFQPSLSLWLMRWLEVGS